MTEDERNLIKEAAKGLEVALHLLIPPTTITLEYRTPASALRHQADVIDYRDKKISELTDLCNRLREASKVRVAP